MTIKTYTQIVSDALTALAERTSITNFNAGSVIRTITEVFSEVVGELYAYGADMLLNGFMDTATGYWLDRRCAEYNITRKAAVKAAGVVTFSRQVAKPTNITIPAGTVVLTPKDSNGVEYRFLTTEEKILVTGDTEVEVPVEAEEAGSAYNVGTGAITRMSVMIVGIDTVTNGADWIATDGVDEETDAELRLRGFMAWETLGTGGTAAAYVAWALAVPGVEAAFVDDDLPRGEGTLDLYILGEEGVPTPELIAEVQAVIDANRPVTADALVLAPAVVTVDVSATVTPRAGWDPVAMDTEIRRRLGIYFGGEADPDEDIVPISIGQDVVVSQIIAVIMGVPGVYSVVLSEPANEVQVDPHEVSELGTVAIIMREAI